MATNLHLYHNLDCWPFPLILYKTNHPPHVHSFSSIQENHMSHWTKAVVIDRESDRPTKCIKEAVHISKEGQRAMN